MIATPLNFRLRHCAVTESTNDDVLVAAAAGEAEGLVLTADRQTDGRGRRGRSWTSPVGNLYASLLMRPRDHAVAGLYCFVTSLALADALAGFVDQSRVQVKWPNDVLLDGAKIAGILLETAPTPDGLALVIGFGVNLTVHPEQARYPTTALKALGFEVERLNPLDFLARVLTAFNHYHIMLHRDGFMPLREIWLARAVGLGEQITVRLPDSELDGKFTTIDANGCLLLEQQNGKLARIAAGDVFLQR
jgi:BirA family biotin operon repressor/biotin-[acetyl-CoA-carboxylase] ligase